MGGENKKWWPCDLIVEPIRIYLSIHFKKKDSKHRETTEAT